MVTLPSEPRGELTEAHLDAEYEVLEESDVPKNLDDSEVELQDGCLKGSVLAPSDWSLCAWPPARLLLQPQACTLAPALGAWPVLVLQSRLWLCPWLEWLE